MPIRSGDTLLTSLSRLVPLVLIALAIAAAPADAAPRVACSDTELTPSASTLPRVRAALLCLHNQIRAQAGLRPLAANSALSRAAQQHSRDMVVRGYFAHDSLDGRSFADRVMVTGYATRDDAWTLGENLAWGRDARATPAAIMTAWMNSAGHRRNILKSVYRDIGLAVTLGAPSGGPNAVTVAVEFGVRRAQRRD